MSDWRQEGSPEPGRAWAWDLNLLCIAGACVGVTALFLAWISESAAWAVDSREPTILDMVVSQRATLVSGEVYSVAAALFLAGSISAFATPAGGILQSISLVVFAQGITESGNEMMWIHPQELRIGMYLGVVSCCLVLTSLLSPLGTGTLRPGKSRKIGVVKRLLTITPSIVEKRP